jgi:hypothetical protein
MNGSAAARRRLAWGAHASAPATRRAASRYGRRFAGVFIEQGKATVENRVVAGENK